VGSRIRHGSLSEQSTNISESRRHLQNISGLQAEWSPAPAAVEACEEGGITSVLFPLKTRINHPSREKAVALHTQWPKVFPVVSMVGPSLARGHGEGGGGGETSK
jgi:hypothetical protein